MGEGFPVRFLLLFGLSLITALISFRYAEALATEAIPSDSSLLSEHTSLSKHFEQDLEMTHWSREIERVLRQLYPSASITAKRSKKKPRRGYRSGDTAIALTNPMFHYPEHWVSVQRITIRILDGDQLTAYALAPGHDGAQPGTVIVSKGMLRALRSESELAFLLAHEIAHVEHQHFSPPQHPLLVLSERHLEHIKRVQRSWEHEADCSAHDLLESAGYEPSASTELLSRIGGRAEISNPKAASIRVAKLKDYAAGATDRWLEELLME